ncbi:MAG: zf-HC2 domain-containing protein [Actinobacteria bacterium]|nr:zf-HC2 domain-containing protein [Actinomycetota bacterium]
MECLSVRERLAELALSALGPDEREGVDRHLEWCAGCRKEAAELADAAAVIGRDLEPHDPPARLEAKVARAVAQAAGRRRTRRVRPAGAVAVAASILAVAAVAWGVFMTGRAREAQAGKQAAVQAANSAQRLAQQTALKLERLLEELQVPDAGARSLQLAPPAGAVGGGGAAVVVDSSNQHYAVVIVAGLQAERLPYRVLLLTDGEIVAVGVIAELAEADGSATAVLDSSTSLFGVTDVVVRDSSGREVLVGKVPPPPTPTIVALG